MLNPKRHLLHAEKRTAQRNRGRERLFAALRRAAHHADQAWPIHLRGALQLPRPRKAETRLIWREKDEAGVVQSAATGAAKHLEQLVRLDLAFEISRQITRIGDEDRAHGKIDPGCESHRRNHDVELTGFGERLNQTGPHRVAETAVMISDAVAQQFCQAFARERFLLRRELEWIAHRHRARDRKRHFFGRVAPRSENQNRREPAMEGARDHARPEFPRPRKAGVRQIAQIDFMLRHWPLIVPDEHRVAAIPAQPIDHVLRIVHAPAEQEQLRFRRGERERQLVMHPAHRIGDELILVDHEQARTLPAGENAPAASRAWRR